MYTEPNPPERSILDDGGPADQLTPTFRNRSGSELTFDLPTPGDADGISLVRFDSFRRGLLRE